MTLYNLAGGMSWNPKVFLEFFFITGKNYLIIMVKIFTLSGRYDIKTNCGDGETDKEISG
jgi:hypothetical protein